MISSLDANNIHHHSYFIEPSYKKWKKGGYGSIYYNPKDYSIIKKIPRYEEHDSSSDVSYPSITTNKEAMYYVYYPAIQEACFSRLLTHFYGFVSLTSIRLSPHYLYLPQEYLGDTLHRHIPTIEAESIPYTIAELLKQCIIMEQHGLQHTDLKTNNLLYDSDTNNVTIIDYNCMSVLTVQNHQLQWRDSIGSWMYVAPEISLDGKVKDSSIVWTIGIVLTQMLQCYPFQQQYYPTDITKTHITDRKEWIVAYKNICLKEQEPLFTKCFQTLTTSYQDILTKIFVSDPVQRPTLTQLYSIWTTTFHLDHDTDLQRYYHEIVVTPFVGWIDEDRYFMVHHTYQFCLQWDETYKFCNMIHIIDHYSPHITEQNLHLVIFSAWTIVSCIMNEHVQDNTEIYHYIKKVHHVECPDICNMVWKMCDTLQWDIYEKPYDVWLLQTNKEVDYDKIVERFIHQRTPYSMKSLCSEVA